VPLVVVPFLVVGVLVMVFLFFGAITGREASMAENLDQLVHGGMNGRQQAAVSLSAQVVKNREARLAGTEPPYETPPDFLEQLQGAWGLMLEDDNPTLRLALAKVLVEHGDPEAREKLVAFLRLPDADDDDGQIRFGALMALGNLGDVAAAEDVLPFLEHPDPYLRQGAASALQGLPGEASIEGLKGVLGDPSLELRGMAAISLSHLGDPSGADVLVDLIDPATYEAIRQGDPRKYADGQLVQNNRIHALRALARLGRAEDDALLEGLAADDADPSVREVAMRALQDRTGGGGG
jgi:HEAT repeat protein